MKRAVPSSAAREVGDALTPDTTKPPVGGFAPTSVEPYGQQAASAGENPVAVTAKVVGVALVNFT